MRGGYFLWNDIWRIVNILYGKKYVHRLMHILYKVQSEEEQFDKIILLLSNELLP